MKKLRVFISGQKYLASRVYDELRLAGHEVVGICCPLSDKYLISRATRDGIKIIPSGMLKADNIPECDLGIAAHSFDFIGRPERYKPKLRWIGYHPSLLPLHRGRSSIEWAIRMGDKITGGTVYWLDSGVDTGDIICQDWCFIPPGKSGKTPSERASDLWRGTLQEMGVKLIKAAVNDIGNGIIKGKRQDEAYATFEPMIESGKRLYRPDAIMLPAGL